MRELKFRAWHKKYKRMYKVLHLHKESDLWATVEGWSVPEDKSIHIRIQPKDCIIMEWTGLQDNNGIDIYEGDIISLDVESESASDPTKTEPDWILAEVRWNHAGFVAWIKADDGDVTCDIPHDTLVLGNIYQNPELLES